MCTHAYVRIYMAVSQNPPTHCDVKTPPRLFLSFHIFGNPTFFLIHNTIFTVNPSLCFRCFQYVLFCLASRLCVGWKMSFFLEGALSHFFGVSTTADTYNNYHYWCSGPHLCPHPSPRRSCGVCGGVPGVLGGVPGGGGYWAFWGGLWATPRGPLVGHWWAEASGIPFGHVFDPFGFV